MPNIIPLHSLSDPALGLFTRLTEAQLRNRLEPEKGIFIAESPKVIRIALDAGYEPAAFLMERKWIDGQASDILARCGDTPVYTAGRELLEQLTGYALTRGVLCAMRRPALPSVEEVCKGARRIAVLEDIADATNVGAIVRSAAALGMDALLVTPCCCDPLNRRAVRVSMGTVFQIPWTRLGSAPSDWPHPGLETLRALGFQTAAMALREDSVSMDDPPPPLGGKARRRPRHRRGRPFLPHHCRLRLHRPHPDGPRCRFVKCRRRQRGRLLAAAGAVNFPYSQNAPSGKPRLRKGRFPYSPVQA